MLEWTASVFGLSNPREKSLCAGVIGDRLFFMVLSKHCQVTQWLNIRTLNICNLTWAYVRQDNGEYIVSSIAFFFDGSYIFTSKLKIFYFQSPFNQVVCFDTEMSTWSICLTTGTPPNNVFVTNMCKNEQMIYVVGGKKSAPNSVTYLFYTINVQTMVWTKLQFRHVMNTLLDTAIDLVEGSLCIFGFSRHRNSDKVQSLPMCIKTANRLNLADNSSSTICSAAHKWKEMLTLETWVFENNVFLLQKHKIHFKTLDSDSVELRITTH